MRALQERGRPPHEPPAPQGRHRASQDQVNRRALSGDETQRRQQRNGLPSNGAGIELAAARLTHRRPHQQRDQQPRNPEHQKRRPPAAALGDRPGHQRAERRPQAGTECVDGVGHGTPRRGKLVGEHRGGGRRAAGLAYADSEARQQQLPVVLSETAHGRHPGPDGECECENVAAVGAIGERGDRDSDRHVEHGQRPAGEQADAGVGEPELLPDGFEERGDRETVRDIERVHHCQDRQHVPAVARRSGRRSAPGVDHRARRLGRRNLHWLQVHSRAPARQPPPAAPVQARPRTARPLAAPVASPWRSARTPFTHTSSTPVASCCGRS